MTHRTPTEQHIPHHTFHIPHHTAHCTLHTAHHLQHNTANGELPASCFISLPQHDAHRHAVRLPVRRTVTVGDVAMPAEQTCENVVAALDAVVGRWVSQRLGGVKVCTPSMLPWHTPRFHGTRTRPVHPQPSTNTPTPSSTHWQMPTHVRLPKIFTHTDTHT